MQIKSILQNCLKSRAHFVTLRENEAIFAKTLKHVITNEQIMRDCKKK